MALDVGLHEVSAKAFATDSKPCEAKVASTRASPSSSSNSSSVKVKGDACKLVAGGGDTATDAAPAGLMWVGAGGANGVSWLSHGRLVDKGGADCVDWLPSAGRPSRVGWLAGAVPAAALSKRCSAEGSSWDRRACASTSKSACALGGVSSKGRVSSCEGSLGWVSSSVAPWGAWSAGASSRPLHSCLAQQGLQPNCSSTSHIWPLLAHPALARNRDPCPEKAHAHVNMWQRPFNEARLLAGFLWSGSRLWHRC